MRPLRSLCDRILYFPDSQVDTDRLFPGEFLKRSDREGMADALLVYERFDAAGNPLPHPFNQENPPSILLTGAEFGTGSSREHAVWALVDYGIRVIIAPSFGDIFYSNCLNNGLLALRLPEGVCAQLAALEQEVLVDVEEQHVKVLESDGVQFSFALDPFRKACLLAGTDMLGYVLDRENEIRAYEQEMHK
ncbi:MAG: 3-isopropylmalate dehydratase small subunit [Nitritalea sp.]